MLSEDQASGFYMNPATGALSFLLGAFRVSAVAASVVSVVLIAVNAI